MLRLSVLLICWLCVASYQYRSIRYKRYVLDSLKSVDITDDIDINAESLSPLSSSLTTQQAAAIIKTLESKLIQPLNAEINDNDSQIEMIVKGLESQYMSMPIQTSQFLNFAISGKWKMIYSSFPTPKADNTIIYNIDQIIKPIEGIDGELENIINWNLNREDDDAYGKLIVTCTYKMTSKGGLEIILKDHTLNVEKIPKNVQELLTTMQRTVPFEFFDPNDYTAITTVSFLFILHLQLITNYSYYYSMWIHN